MNKAKRLFDMIESHLRKLNKKELKQFKEQLPELEKFIDCGIEMKK